MSDSIFACPDHGYFVGDRCPDCGELGDRVLDHGRRRRLSKFLSGALRHFPDDAGIELDGRGWTEFEAVVETVERKYDWATREHVEGVVATDPKGRFEREGDRIRAAYGHSVDVTLEADETPVPDTLYHGTAPRNVDDILREGLKPMGRQQVHLSETVEEARTVGRRHAGDPVVLEVDAAAMAKGGFQITERGDGIYTTERVLREYLELQPDHRTGDQ